MSRWKKISLAVLVFVVLLIGAVGFLVGTTTGLHVLFNAANRWVPGLDITSVTGGWRNLTIKGLRYEQPGVDVRAGEVNHHQWRFHERILFTQDRRVLRVDCRLAQGLSQCLSVLSRQI